MALNIHLIENFFKQKLWMSMTNILSWMRSVV